MAGTETLVAMGFPVHAALHEQLLAARPPITSFAVKLASRSPRSVAGKAGNTMHLGCLLPQIMYDYRGIRLISDNPIIRSLSLHKRRLESRGTDQHEQAEQEQQKRSRQDKGEHSADGASGTT